MQKLGFCLGSDQRVYELSSIQCLRDQLTCAGSYFPSYGIPLSWLVLLRMIDHSQSLLPLLPLACGVSSSLHPQRLSDYRVEARSLPTYLPGGAHPIFLAKMASISVKATAVHDGIKDLRRCAERPKASRPPPPSTVTGETLADISERFALWARNIGALHPPRSQLSLDSRLRDIPEIQEWVCELLDDLKEALDDRKSDLSGRFATNST